MWRKEQDPSKGPANLFLLDTRGPHKKEALQLPQTGQCFNEAFKIWGTPENSVPRQDTVGHSGL